MPKQFISFLGTNDYIPCNYFFENIKVENVKYIQTGVCEIFCKDFKNEDKVTIFVTNEAYNRNGVTLKKEFECHGLKEPELIAIPSGKKEKELWKLFETVFNSLQGNAAIIFDITHSFRYIPMLSIVLLNYAAFVKNIEIEGIYYGALESLGNIQEVKNMDISQRNVPIYNLTPLATIQKWAIAVENFVQSGNVEQLNKTFTFIRKKHFTSQSPINSDEQIKKAHSLIYNLREFLGDISTNRGLKLEGANTIKKLQENLKEFNKAFSTSSPLSPLLKINNKLETIITSYNTENPSIGNLLYSVELCIKYGLIQQGYTQLQELIITFLCRKFGFDYLQYERNRQVIASMLNVMALKIPEEKWKYPLTEIDKQRLKQMSEDEIFKKLAPLFASLTNFRNDINHGGFNNNPTQNSEKFASHLRKIHMKVKKILQKEV